MTQLWAEPDWTSGPSKVASDSTDHGAKSAESKSDKSPTTLKKTKTGYIKRI